MFHVFIITIQSMVLYVKDVKEVNEETLILTIKG